MQDSRAKMIGANRCWFSEASITSDHRQLNSKEMKRSMEKKKHLKNSLEEMKMSLHEEHSKAKGEKFAKPQASMSISHIEFLKKMAKAESLLMQVDSMLKDIQYIRGKKRHSEYTCSQTAKMLNMCSSIGSNLRKGHDCVNRSNSKMTDSAKKFDGLYKRMAVLDSEKGQDLSPITNRNNSGIADPAMELGETRRKMNASSSNKCECSLSVDHMMSPADQDSSLLIDPNTSKSVVILDESRVTTDDPDTCIAQDDPSPRITTDSKNSKAVEDAVTLPEKYIPKVTDSNKSAEDSFFAILVAALFLMFPVSILKLIHYVIKYDN